MTDDELKKTYVNAQAFLFASKDEEFGIAPVEAMGYGLPVIAFRSGGLPEYVVDSKNGYLFDKLEESSLIDKVNKLTSLASSKYLEMRKEARKTAEGFSEEKFIQNIKQFIKSKA
ncbi:MAG: glycosyl transferase group 1 [uncultured bacterium]|nr:MAG: glycosyl transferase group 1 [uncultured bacterium]